MTLLPTETVTFRVVTGESTDDFGDTHLTYEDHVVTDCLVEPGSATELAQGYDLNQDTTVTVHLPDNFTEELVNATAVVRGLDYRVVRSPIAYTRSPLQWNRHVVLEGVSDGSTS